MARVVDVPLNTAIADLDEALRILLKRELDKHGFEGVEIAFDAIPQSRISIGASRASFHRMRSQRARVAPGLRK